ncbi:hypothetical protein [Streptomyces sp. NPDC002276]
MQHVSTPLARTLGAAALLSASIAWAATALPPRDTPRLDVLVPLGLASMFSLGWVLASRAAPLVEPLPVAAAPQERIPGTLGAVRRGWGFFLISFLVVWAPCASASAAAGKGVDPFLFSLYSVVAWFFGAASTVFASALLRNPLGPGQRMLREDAAAGGVHAIRVRFHKPVKVSHRYPTGKGVGQIGTARNYYVELTPENEADRQRAVQLHAVPGDNFRMGVGEKHLAHAAAQLMGHGGWLCWPTRWQDIAGTDKARLVPAVFVSDSGHVVWGQTHSDDYGKYLRAGAAPVCRTDTAFAVAPLPVPSRYFPKAYAVSLSIAAGGALLCVPVLLGVVPHWAGMLLSVLAGCVGLFAGIKMGGVGMVEEPWTVRYTAHPSLR